LSCVLTTTTTTGFAFARKNAEPWIEVMYSPLDCWPVMRRAFSVIRPSKIVLIEAEVWPNQVAFAHARAIPIALVNARLSPRSESRFRRFRPFLAPTFRLLDLVCVPEKEDITRWNKIGVDQDRIRHTGSIKYDPEGSDRSIEPPALKGNGTDLVLLGGSTHAGEEKLLAQVFLRLRPRFPSLSLFIAPRHVERVREIRKELQALSLRVRLASEAGDADSKPDCVLLDKTGELRRWYTLATVVFIGKSLTARGGQNPVEPIAAGVPVIFGPHMENFATLAKGLTSENGAIQVANESALEESAAMLLCDPIARDSLVKNAEQVLMAHRGATARTAALVAALRPAV
jgi:3-deoxy-D-manno-octulosonic-acid transferase